MTKGFSDDLLFFAVDLMDFGKRNRLQINLILGPNEEVWMAAFHGGGGCIFVIN